MKKLLFISPTFYPNVYFGGTIFSSLNMCKDLSRIYDVTVLNHLKHYLNNTIRIF